MHLIVAHHGLWGDHTHLNYLLNEIEEAAKKRRQLLEEQQEDPTDANGSGTFHPFPLDVEIINCKLNEGTLTYAGIDVCGGRLAVCIYATVRCL
jgi:hypothetical protein